MSLKAKRFFLAAVSIAAVALLMLSGCTDRLSPRADVDGFVTRDDTALTVCSPTGNVFFTLTVENGRCEVEERRVIYDAEELIAQVKCTGQYRAARVWSEMIFAEWRTCREMAMYMLRYIEAYARRTGDERRPFMADTWEAGFAAWQAEANPWVMVEDGDFPR